MSPLRTFVSSIAVLAAVSGLAGCYDLSTPSGPHREDFMRYPTSTATPDDHAHSAELTCEQEPCVADLAIVRDQLQPVQLDRADEDLTEPTRPIGGGAR